MPLPLRTRLRLLPVLCAGLLAAHAGAQTGRAVMEPFPGAQLSYERFDPSPAPPGRFDGSLATPLGTLRATVRAVPAGERHFQRGDTSFELPSPLFDGQLQLRELAAGGAEAAWRGRVDAGLAAETRYEWTPARSGQALRLQQQFGAEHVGHALLSNSRTALAQGTRWDIELAQVSGRARWSAGVDSAERSYVSPSGGLEPRVGLRLGTQWRLFPFTQVEARYTRQLRWDAEARASSVMLGTRFDLPRRLTLVTGVETDAEDRHKASLTLTVPLESR